MRVSLLPLSPTALPGRPVSLLWNNQDCQFLVHSTKDLNYICNEGIEDNQGKRETEHCRQREQPQPVEEWGPWAARQNKAQLREGPSQGKEFGFYLETIGQSSMGLELRAGRYLIKCMI